MSIRNNYKKFYTSYNLLPNMTEEEYLQIKNYYIATVENILNDILDGRIKITSASTTFQIKLNAGKSLKYILSIPYASDEKAVLQAVENILNGGIENDRYVKTFLAAKEYVYHEGLMDLQNSTGPLVKAYSVIVDKISDFEVIFKDKDTAEAFKDFITDRINATYCIAVDDLKEGRLKDTQYAVKSAIFFLRDGNLEVNIPFLKASIADGQTKQTDIEVENVINSIKIQETYLPEDILDKYGVVSVTPVQLLEDFTEEAEGVLGF